MRAQPVHRLSAKLVAGLAASLVAACAGARAQGSLAQGAGAWPAQQDVRAGWTAVRKVQVIGLSDTVARHPPNAGPGTSPGAPAAGDTFCLIDTAGGPVRLRIFSPNGPTSSAAFQAVSAGGTTLDYSLQIESITLGVKAAYNAAEGAFDLPPGAAAPSAAACGAGNLRKTLTVLRAAASGPNQPPVPRTGQLHADTLILVATPL